MKNILWSLLLVAAFGLNAHATPLDDKIKAFDAALKAATPAGSSDPMYAVRLTQQLGAPMGPGAEAPVEASVRQIMATNSSKAVQETGEALIAELQAQEKAELNALTAKIDAVLAPVPAAVAKAEKPADLDATLTDLLRATPANAGEYGYGYDPDFRAQNTRLTSAYQFVAQWQDYLSARESKKDQEALNSLHNLLNSRPGAESIMPRSEILARISLLDANTKPTGNLTPGYAPPQSPDITPILDGVKTLDDIEPAVRQITALPNGQGYDVSELGQFAFLYGQAKNGLAVSLDLHPNNYGRVTPHPGLARIESMLLLYLLPRFLGPDAPAPNANEQVKDYLERVTASAEAAQNWALLQRVVDAQIKIAQAQQTPAGAQSFLAGLNQEMAGQYALAVQDYERALNTPDTYTSPKLIGDLLAAIKKAHAAEYAEGMKNVLSPPQRNYPPGYYGFNPYAGRPGMPGYPGGEPAVAPAVVRPAAPAPTLQTNAAPVTPTPVAK